MTRDDRRYARFYFPEFIRDYNAVYRNDAALATWIRLLVIAEQMWPMAADLPRSIRATPLRVLTDAGLVTTDGTSFEIKGHAAERSRRRDSGRVGASVRWDGPGNANASANASANAVPSTSTSTREGKRDSNPVEKRAGPRLVDPLDRLA